MSGRTWLVLLATGGPGGSGIVPVLVRALTYAATFVGVVLILLPRVLLTEGADPPPGTGPAQVGGAALGAAGALLVLWCVVVFAVVGRGTPAPFDPPVRLVERGPYRYVRNPMYAGALLALAGAAVFYRSLSLLAFMAVFGLIAHAFVRLYEEPTLRRLFGPDYDDYRRRVRRWLPVRRRTGPPE